MKRRGAGLKKRRAGKNWKGTRGSKSVHTGDARSLGTAGTKA
jgi:hypothetical protein